MSQAVISNNQSIKVNRFISGTTTVNANCYAIVTYKVTAVDESSPSSVAYGFAGIVTVHYGPNQSIPATLTSLVGFNGGASRTGTYSLISGVEFINSP